MEGGGHTLRLISEYLYDDPPIPIILFAGSGKITDLVAWMLSRFTSEDEMLSCYDEVMSRIDKIFHIGAQASSEVFQELKQIYQRKILVCNLALQFDIIQLDMIFNRENLQTHEPLIIYRSQSTMETLQMKKHLIRLYLHQSFEISTGHL